MDYKLIVLLACNTTRQVLFVGCERTVDLPYKTNQTMLEDFIPYFCIIFKIIFTFCL